MADPPADVCSEDDTTPPESLSFLFIGNSYTGTNQLPQLVKTAIETASHDKTKVKLEAHAPPGRNFLSHLKNLQGQGDHGDHHLLHEWILAASNNDTKSRHYKPWNFAILQNQSQEAAFWKDSPSQYLQGLEAIREFCQKVRTHYPSTRILFFQTWGRLKEDKRNPTIFPDYTTMQDLLTKGYSQYAHAIGTPEHPVFVAPVGLAFETIFKECEGDPTQEGTLFHALYQRDASHPSLAGSYVAALTIYATITVMQGGKDTAAFPPVDDLDWVPEGLEADRARQLRGAVRQTMQRAFQENIIQYPPW